MPLPRQPDSPSRALRLARCATVALLLAAATLLVPPATADLQRSVPDPDPVALEAAVNDLIVKAWEEVPWDQLPSEVTTEHLFQVSFYSMDFMLRVCFGPQGPPRIDFTVENGVLVWFPSPDMSTGWVAGAARSCP